jgi:hypothetical protein
MRNGLFSENAHVFVKDEEERKFYLEEELDHPKYLSQMEEFSENYQSFSEWFCLTFSRELHD